MLYSGSTIGLGNITNKVFGYLHWYADGTKTSGEYLCLFMPIPQISCSSKLSKNVLIIPLISPLPKYRMFVDLYLANSLVAFICSVFPRSFL